MPTPSRMIERIAMHLARQGLRRALRGGKFAGKMPRKTGKPGKPRATKAATQAAPDQQSPRPAKPRSTSGRFFSQANISGFDSGLSVLFLAAFPLLLWLFQGSAINALTAVVLIAMLGTALRLIAMGQKRQRAYENAELALAPRLPMKLIGSGLVGIVVMVLAANHFMQVAMPMAFGFAAACLSLLAFGMDPVHDKGLDDPVLMARLEADTLQIVTDDTLLELTERVADLGDARLTMRSDALRNRTMHLIRAFGSPPGDLMRMQRPITKLTEIFALEVDRLERAWHSDRHVFARHRFEAKLQVLLDSFEERTRRSGVKAGNDAFDLEADLLIDPMRKGTAA